MAAHKLTLSPSFKHSPSSALNNLVSTAIQRDPVLAATVAALPSGSSPVHQQSVTVMTNRGGFPQGNEKNSPLLRKESLGKKNSIPEAVPVAKDRVVMYVEHNGSRYIRHMLNFDSPRTAEAAAQLGITYEDCLKKYLA
jgi:hypothetical protein